MDFTMNAIKIPTTLRKCTIRGQLRFNAKYMRAYARTFKTRNNDKLNAPRETRPITTLTTTHAPTPPSAKRSAQTSENERSPLDTKTISLFTMVTR